MGLFDVFSAQPAQDAAQAKIAGLNSAYAQYAPLAQSGREAITSNYGQAAQPFQSLLDQYKGGIGAYGDATGANGAAGFNSAAANFRNTPGYQFALDQGVDAINRSGVARGSATGNILRGAQTFGSGLADQTYQNYVKNLQPYIGAGNQAAGGYSGVLTGEGNQLANNYGQQGTVAYGTQAGIGDANAASELAPYNASANLWNFGLNAAKTGASAFGFGGLGTGTPKPQPVAQQQPGSYGYFG